MYIVQQDVYSTSHGGFHCNPSLNKANTLEASDYKDSPILAYKTEGVDCYNMDLTGDKAKTITCSASDPSHVPCVVQNKVHYVVRRLTPRECERL